MEHAITIGDVIMVSLIAGGVITVIGGLIWVLSVYASGFDH